MIVLLRFAFAAIVVAMLGVTSWASLQVTLWETPRAVATHPWFIATLFDTYFGFLTFWLWLAWRERSGIRSAAWLVAILLLGNIAMATYVLIQLFRLPTTASVDQLFTRRPR